MSGAFAVVAVPVIVALMIAAGTHQVLGVLWAGFDVAIRTPSGVPQVIDCLTRFGWLDEEPDIDPERWGLRR